MEPQTHETPVTGDVPGTLSSEIETQRQKSVRLLSEFASTLHRAADEISHKGGSSARWASEKMHDAAHYLQSHYASEMAADLERTVRQYPGYSIVVAAAAGFVAGRTIRGLFR